MARERLPLFLARSSYRKRRKMDALKMLAFFGAILWLIPAIWRGTERLGKAPSEGALGFANAANDDGSAPSSSTPGS